jgi:tRNA A22 N-methylase
MSNRQYRASKVSCATCGIDHPYFACNLPQNSPIDLTQTNSVNTTELILSQVLKENQSLSQELREIKSLLTDVLLELRKSSKKKVLED